MQEALNNAELTPGLRSFWAEMAPTEHLVQLYGDDGAILDSLEGFVAGGLLRDEAVIVIATPSHLGALRRRLGDRDDLDMDAARRSDQFIAVDAEETLAEFMVQREGAGAGAWPDAERFERAVSGLLTRARWGGEMGGRLAAGGTSRGGERKVRAFGEMVAVLWARGDAGATVQLEHLWNRAQRGVGGSGAGFPLFCAYPRSGFTQDTGASLRDICACHSLVVGGEGAHVN